MSKTIMIVDDSASVRQLVSMVLKSKGYTVQEAVDGRDALDKLGNERVHLVISDVNMPRLDGIGFVQELKQRPAHRFTPVLMLTTESEQHKKQAGQQAGARAWMVKPFAPEQLLNAVQKLCLP